MENEEVVKLIQETAVRASSANGKIAVIQTPELGPGKCLIVKGNGDYGIVTKVESRSHQLQDIESVTKWCVYAAGTLEAHPTLWIGRDGIRVIMDDADRSSPVPLIYYQFRKTPEYLRLLSLHSRPEAFEQKAFIRMLRTELWDCLDFNSRESLLRNLKQLISSERGSGKSVVGAGRESYGREIEMSVSSTLGDIPETLELSVQLFQDSSLTGRRVIECDLEISPDSFRFQLTPLASKMESVLEDELQGMIGLLQANLSADTPMFRGVYKDLS